MKRSTIWLDHHHAHILDYDKDGIKQHTFTLEHEGKVTKEQLRKFYHDLASKLQHSGLLLVLGPGQAKEEFKNHCEDHHPALGRAIFKVETTEAKLSEAGLKKLAGELFEQHFEWNGTK